MEPKPNLAEEIEITPAMVEAGVLCWLEGDPRVEEIEIIIRRVFAAMLDAHHKSGLITGTLKPGNLNK